MRVLLVEDDNTYADSIELMLKSEGMVIDTTDLGEDGLEIGKLYDYDIILLDLMLPDIDGYEVLRRLRDARVDTPVLILSGLTETEDKVKGLGFGADDYLTKPFHTEELLARLRALTRRAAGHTTSTIECGELSIDTRGARVFIDGAPVKVTSHEFRMLSYLAHHQDRTSSCASCAGSSRVMMWHRSLHTTTRPRTSKTKRPVVDATR